MRRSALIVAVAAVVLIVGGVTAAIALSGDDLPDVPVTQDEAIAAATAAVPGDVVEVELERENGVVGYEVDVTDYHVLRKIAGDVVSDYGGCNHLVYAAGVGSGSEKSEIRLAGF